MIIIDPAVTTVTIWDTKNGAAPCGVESIQRMMDDGWSHELALRVDDAIYNTAGAALRQRLAAAKN